MKPYVMFGVHPLFGDYADAIHESGGYLARVVLNVSEPERPEGQRFSDSLGRYHSWLESQGEVRRVEVLRLEDYEPEADETALLGFRGLKCLPLVEELKNRHGISFVPLAHPSAQVSQTAALGEGAFVGSGAVIAPNARIGPFCLVNRGATIGHDAILEECVVVGPGANTASFVRLGRGSVMGIASTVIENLTVGEGSYVAAGAVVLRDVAPRRLVAGVPAVEKKVLGQSRG